MYNIDFTTAAFPQNLDQIKQKGGSFLKLAQKLLSDHVNVNYGSRDRDQSHPDTPIQSVPATLLSLPVPHYCFGTHCFDQSAEILVPGN